MLNADFIQLNVNIKFKVSGNGQISFSFLNDYNLSLFYC